MSGAVHAFLVGIDDYAGDVASLNGCRADIEHAAGVLERYAAAAGRPLSLTTLLDREATREAVISTFRSALGKAGDGDTALFWYCGHGSQEEAPPEHLPFEPDGLDETVVLADSRAEGGTDLADKELGVLVDEVAAAGAHVVVVLDCCHSGSGVRGEDGLTAVRRAPARRGARPASSYLPGTAASAAEAAGARLGGRRYVLLAACRSDQTAKEVLVDGGSRGALSVAVEAALNAASGPMSYVQLHRAVAACVRAAVAEQTPVLECAPAAEADREILGGGRVSSGGLHVATWGSGGWRLDAGALHGVPSPSATAATTVTLHPLDAVDLGPDTVEARTRVVDVRATYSLLAEPQPVHAPVDRTRVHRAVVRELPDAEVRLWLGPDLPDRDRLRETLIRPGVVKADGPESADLVLSAAGGQVRLVRPGARSPLVSAREPDAAGALSDADVDALRGEVALVGRWLALLRRHNPTSALPAGSLVLEVLDTADRPLPVDADGSVRLVWPQDGDAVQRIRVRVTNTGGVRLYVAVLALSELYGVSPLLAPECEALDAGASLYVPSTTDASNDIYVSLPAHTVLTTDVLKVVASTREFTSRSFAQDELAPPPVDRPTRGPSGERLVSSAAPTGLPGDSEDWTTTEVALTSYRPGAFVPLARAAVTQLDAGVVVEPHAVVRGRVRIAPAVEAARDCAVPLVPAALLDDTGVRAFSFLPARAAGTETDVLELEDVDGADGVTPSAPLVLRVPQRLADDELVLPLMFDGEDYLPVGLGRPDGDGTRIRLDRLPDQGEITARSLGRSLKILFRKLVVRRLGGAYDWPRLSLVRFERDGTTTYDHDPDVVARALAGARTALLLVHGIIGDTAGMAQAAGRAPWDLRSVADVVLAFDYENLDTSIGRTGADLAVALRAVGIDPDRGTGPRLTVLAHSMGGLVARCFLERQGGARVVDRLVTCGTPMAGSPWSTLEDWVTSLLGLGLNGMLPLGGPVGMLASLLGTLAGAVERVDTALDEMRPGSDLLVGLAAAADPGVPYVTVRGTRPLPETADARRAARIVRKLTGTALGTLFGEEPNDIAVTVRSAGAVGAAWPHPPLAQDADCNHLSYFATPQGLDVVHAALGLGRA